jgi:multidrug efflux pump subunit AcrA (membrane-fusion protein)
MELNRNAKPETAPMGPKEPGQNLRKVAGKALLIFLALMALLTLANRALNELAIAEVSAARPQRGALEMRVDASGQLSAAEVVPIYAEASLHVAQVHVRAGQQVAKGDPLFTFEGDSLAEFLRDKEKAEEAAAQSLTDARQAFAYAKADMRTTALDAYGDAEARIQRTQAAYDAAVAEGAPQRTQELRRNEWEAAIRARDRMTGVRSYFEKERALSKAEGEHASAADDLENARRIAQNATIRASWDAQVISVDIEPGITASTETAAMILAGLTGEWELIALVSEEEAKDLEAGDMADVILGGSRYQCPILSLAASAGEVGKAEMAFRLPGSAGRSGMSAKVEIRKRTQNHDLLIPLSALRRDNGGYYVYVITSREGALGAETTVSRANVALLEQDATRVAVQGGVSLQDQIVTRGDRELHAGDRVRVRED